MTDDYPPGLPDGFELARADDMERVVADDGTAYRVLVSYISDERALVREDVVEYDGALDHPATGAAAAFVALLAALITPIALGLCAVTCWGVATAPRGGYLVGIAATGLGVFAFNRLLWHTALRAWVVRFEEWLEYRPLIMATRGTEA